MQNKPCALWLSAVRVGILSLMLTCTIAGWCSAAESGHDKGAVEATSPEKWDFGKFALIAAAIAFAAGSISAGYAIAHVGAAAMGAIAEKPEIAGQALIFIALAEGLVVFGFITALMILGKV